jgi:hypothetical protein
VCGWRIGSCNGWPILRRGGANEPLPDEIAASVSDIPGLSDVVADAPEVTAAWPAGAVRVARGRRTTR